jgi:hypothetical protein
MRREFEVFEQCGTWFLAPAESGHPARVGQSLSTILTTTHPVCGLYKPLRFSHTS